MAIYLYINMVNGDGDENNCEDNVFIYLFIINYIYLILLILFFI